jgi:hypothetical protein
MNTMGLIERDRASQLFCWRNRDRTTIAVATLISVKPSVKHRKKLPVPQKMVANAVTTQGLGSNDIRGATPSVVSSAASSLLSQQNNPMTAIIETARSPSKDGI